MGDPGACVKGSAGGTYIADQLRSALKIAEMNEGGSGGNSSGGKCPAGNSERNDMGDMDL